LFFLRIALTLPSGAGGASFPALKPAQTLRHPERLSAIYDLRQFAMTFSPPSNPPPLVRQLAGVLKTMPSICSGPPLSDSHFRFFHRSLSPSLN
jgi:hypothetical protein